MINTPLKLKSTLKDNICQLGSLFLEMLPAKRLEWFLLIAVTILYFSYSIFLALQTTVIDNPKIIYDLYFSFDHIPMFHEGYTTRLSHPLLYEITRPILLIGDVFIKLMGVKGKTVLSVLFCNVLISFSVLYIFKYLKNVLKLATKDAIVIALLFAFFSTNMVLCFTPESFTLSAFIIPFVVYYYSEKIKNNQNIHILPSAFLVLFTGGVTITNTPKALLPLLFTNEKLKTKLLKISSLCILMFGILVRLYFILQGNPIARGFNYYQRFSIDAHRRQAYEDIIDRFFGASIFFPSLTIDKLYHTHPMIDIGTYSHWWQYLFVAVIYGMVVISIFRNKGNKLIWIVAGCFMVDISIHVILKFGIYDGFLYGGHWVCFIPLLIGWFYKSIPIDIRKYLFVLLFILLIGLIFNNSMKIYEFINIAKQMYSIKL